MLGFSAGILFCLASTGFFRACFRKTGEPLELSTIIQIIQDRYSLDVAVVNHATLGRHRNERTKSYPDRNVLLPCCYTAWRSVRHPCSSL